MYIYPYIVVRGCFPRSSRVAVTILACFMSYNLRGTPTSTPMKAPSKKKTAKPSPSKAATSPSKTAKSSPAKAKSSPAKENTRRKMQWNDDQRAFVAQWMVDNKQYYLKKGIPASKKYQTILDWIPRHVFEPEWQDKLTITNIETCCRYLETEYKSADK